MALLYGCLMRNSLQQKLARNAVDHGVVVGKHQGACASVLRQQVGENAQLAGRTKGNGTRLAVCQHGTASGPRAGASFDEGLPARQRAQPNALVLQEAIARVNQRIITLTLALGE